MSPKSCSYCMLVTCTSTLILLALSLFFLKDDPPIPSLSLLSLTGTPAAINVGSSSCTVHNLTTVVSLSGRNKVPAIFTDFHLFGRQDNFLGNVRSPNDFISASMASASVQSLEQSGEWSETIAFSVPEESLYIAPWMTVEKDNETIRSGLTRLHIYPSFIARYAGGKRWSTFIGFTEFRCGDSTQSSKGDPLLAEVVVYSGNRSLELNFSKDVFSCDCFRPWDFPMLAFCSVCVSILLGIAAEILRRARAETKV